MLVPFPITPLLRNPSVRGFFQIVKTSCEQLALRIACEDELKKPYHLGRHAIRGAHAARETRQVWDRLSVGQRKEVHMTDYRFPHDPIYGHEPADRTRFRGLIAGLVCLVIFLGLGLALGVGHRPPTHIVSNNATPQQTTAPAVPPTTPGLASPPSQAPNRP
jgi:hypothetical protein